MGREKMVVSCPLNCSKRSTKGGDTKADFLGDPFRRNGCRIDMLMKAERPRHSVDDLLIVQCSTGLL